MLMAVLVLQDNGWHSYATISVITVSTGMYFDISHTHRLTYSLKNTCPSLKAQGDKDPVHAETQMTHHACVSM